jgi:hypothetical protein
MSWGSMARIPNGSFLIVSDDFRIMRIQFGCGLLFGVSITFLKDLYELLTLTVDHLEAIGVALTLRIIVDLTTQSFPYSINNIVCQGVSPGNQIERV